VSEGLANLRGAAALLIGAEFRETARAVEMQMFLFGPDAEVTTYARGTFTRPRFAVHLQCAWRLTRNGTIVVGSWDQDDEPQNPGEPWERRSAALRAELDGDSGLIIVDVGLSDRGDLTLSFSDGAELQAFVDSSIADQECYRLIDATGDHFVVMGGANVEVVGPSE
jgi:hypothetical protein